MGPLDPDLEAEDRLPPLPGQPGSRPRLPARPHRALRRAAHKGPCSRTAPSRSSPRSARDIPDTHDDDDDEEDRRRSEGDSAQCAGLADQHGLSHVAVDRAGPVGRRQPIGEPTTWRSRLPGRIPSARSLKTLRSWRATARDSRIRTTQSKPSRPPTCRRSTIRWPRRWKSASSSWGRRRARSPDR